MIKTSFEKFNESTTAPPFVLLIDDNGEEYTTNGDYEYGNGIFDTKGNEYPAAVDRDGTVWASVVKEDGVLKLKGDGFVPGLEKAMKNGFNYFEGFE